MPVSVEQVREYQKQLRKLERESVDLSADARAHVMRTVNEHRQRIDDLISDYPGKQPIPAADIPRISQQIQREVSNMLDDAYVALAQAQSEAFTLAVTASAGLADSLDLQGAFFTPTTDLLVVAQSYTASLVRSIGEELMPKVNAALSRSALGVMSPYETMQAIDELIGKGAASGVSFQAERIVRTEVQRIYSVAMNSQVQRIAEKVEVDKVMKRWRSGPNRPGRRQSHQAADGQEVPVNEPFVIVDDRTGQKVKLMYPRDPGGPPEHTIMCGCQWEVISGSIMDAAMSQEPNRR